MKHRSKKLLSLLLVLSMLVGLFATTAVAAPAASNAEVYDIRVDDLTAPVGIDNPNPVFSWKMKSDAIGAAQTAYSIIVTSQAGTDVWTTGWVTSSDSVAIPYNGTALAASTEYTVKIAIKDQTGAETAYAESTFETGLMGALDDVRWISLDDVQTVTPQTATTYTIDFDFILDSGNQGFAFGMQDKQNYVMWQINGFVNRNSDKAMLLRPHFRVNGSWITGDNVDITKAIGYDSETIIGQLIHERIVVDGKEIKLYFGPNADTLTLANTYTYTEEIPLYNIGFRQNTSSTGGTEIARYDNFVITDGVDGTGNVLYTQDFSGDYTLEGSSNYTVVDGMLKGGSTSNGESIGMLVTGNADTETNDNLPAFRRSFTTKEVASAKLYTSGLGVYESYLNGQRVGRLLADGTVEYHELKPGFTEMGKRKFYSAYDVTWMLKDNAENVLSAVVSGGWWSGAVGRNYGSEDAYWAKLLLTYTDGTTETLVTDTDWNAAKQSPLQKGTGIFEGERYDARVNTDWMLPGYDASDWSNAKVNREFTGKLTVWDGEPVTVRQDLERVPQQLYVYDSIEGASSGYYGKVHIARTYTDGEAITLNPGETLIVDFGQNFAGWEAFTVQAEAGTTVHVKHGEMLNDGNGATSRGCDGPEGSVYNTNYRTATADTYYTASGSGAETYHPSHTYYGFRYAAFTADKAVTLTNIRGQVVTSVREDTAWMTTSNQDVNQLISNIRWGMYSNYLSIPTDCPQRSERMGWTGDAQSFAEAGVYLGNNKSFLEKYLVDLRDTQRSNGAYAGTAPTGSYGGASYGALGWADAGIIIPYYLYVVYGDTSTVAEHWNSMVLYMDTYMASTNGMGGNHSYGDHVSYESNDDTIKDMLGVSYYAWDAMLMSRMAEALGKTEDAARYQALYETEKALYQSLYVNEDGSLLRSEQTPCLYALYLDLLPDAASVEAVTNQLITNIERNGNKLQTGFLGTEIIMHTLTKIGRSDVAYKLLLQHDCPSWLYSVDQGATTMWESWNAYTISGGIAGSRNSFNHYSFGAVASWMFRGMAGIGYDVENPGFKHILLSPQPNQLLPSVDASFESVYGTIVSKINHAGETWTYDCTLPANTTATIRLPVEKIATLTANGQTDLTAVNGLTYLGYQNGVATFEAVAGSYRFASQVEVKQYVTLNVVSDASVPMAGAEVYLNGKLAAAGLPATLTVSGGDVITAKATAKNSVDYAVTHWTLGDTTICDQAELTYTVDGSAAITAHVEYVGYENLAVGKSVETTQHNTSWSASYLTDGILNTLGGSKGWSSSSRGTGSLTFNEHFTILDLGETTQFNRFQLYPRDFGVTELEGFPVAYTFYVSDDHETWTPVYTTDHGALLNNLYEPLVVQLDETAEGRYVRLGVTEVNKLDQGNRAFVQLNELGVYLANEAPEKVALLVTGAAETSVAEGAVSYTVSARNMNRLATVLLTFRVSEETLTNPAAEPAAEDWTIIAQTYENGVLTVSAFSKAGTDGDADLLKITAQPTGQAGTATLEITQAELCAYEGEGETYVPADLTQASAATTVTRNLYDVNGDGVVNLLDVTRAQRHYGTDNFTCDVNHDGTVDINDLILILNNFTVLN